MIHHRRTRVAASLLAGAVSTLAFPPSAVSKPTVIRGSATPTVSVFSMGFNNPRGLKFGPDGMLYVAEGGTGGSTFTSGCDQVPGPVGPYSGSPTGGRISRVNSEGNRTTVTDQLPSSNANPQIGGDVEGVSDVAFMGNTLYALVAGGGCSHGVRGHPNGIYRIGAGGSATLVANLSAFLKSHPVANPFAGDFEPDGTPYSMIAERGSFYLVEPNHGELDRASPGGTISQEDRRHQREPGAHRARVARFPRRVLRREPQHIPDRAGLVEDHADHPKRPNPYCGDGAFRPCSKSRSTIAHACTRWK